MGFVSAATNVTGDVVSIVDEIDIVEVNSEDISVDLDNEKSFSSEDNQNISSDSTNMLNSIDDSTILGISYTNHLTDGSNYATDVIGGVSGEIISDGDNFIFRPVDRQDVIIKKDINNQFRNYDFQIYNMLPTSFKYGDYIYVLREPSSEISNEWYYDKIYLPKDNEMYILHLEAPYDANGQIGGFAGDKMGVYAKVTDSKGTPVDGYVVFDDLATKSSPIMLTNGRAYYEYTLKYTGPNGGFIYAYFYKGGYSDANLMAKTSIKYVGLRTTYVFEFDQDTYYYSYENKWVRFNISVYNKDKPWKVVSGKIQAAFSQDDWMSDGIRPRDIVWDPILQKGTASFTLFVEGRNFVRFRLMPGDTIRCDEYYIPVKWLNSPFIDANIERVGSQINVNMTFTDQNNQAIGFGEATLDIPSVNKTFTFNVTNKMIQFSFSQEDYFLNETTMFYVSFHDKLDLFKEGFAEFKFKDDIYYSKIVSIDDLNFDYLDLLNPKVNLNLSLYDPDKVGYVVVDISGKKFVQNIYDDCAEFNIKRFLSPGQFNVTFEYYYDELHSCLDTKNVTITISNNTSLDIIVVNDWVYGDSLQPKLEVIDRKCNRTFDGDSIAYKISPSSSSQNNFVEEKLVNNAVMFNFGKLDKADVLNTKYQNSFYFIYEGVVAFKKDIVFQPIKRTIELICPDCINLTIGENMTFNVYINDFENILKMIPQIKYWDHYPLLKVSNPSDNVKFVNSDYRDGRYAFSYSPSYDSEIYLYISGHRYLQGKITIPTIIKKLDAPTVEIGNNGAVSFTDKTIKLKFTNRTSFQGTITLETDEYGKLDYVTSSNGYSYYEMPFNTTGVKKIYMTYVPSRYSPFNSFERILTVNVSKGMLEFTTDTYSGKFNETIPISIGVNGVSGVFPTGDATLTLNNKEYLMKIIQNKISADITLPNKPGVYPVKLYYGGDSIFDSASLLFNISVYKQNLTLITDSLIKVKPNDMISLNLSAVSEFNLNTVINHVNINLGKNKILCEVIDNKISFKMPEVISFNNISIDFSGNDYYNFASKTIDIMNTDLDINVISVIKNNNVELTVTLSENVSVFANLILNNNKLPIYFIKGKYSDIFHGLEIGNHSLQIQIDDSIFSGSKSTIISVPDYHIQTILSEYQTGGYKGNGIYSVKLTDMNGNSIANQRINLIVNGEEEIVYTNSEGIGTLTIINSGTYNITAKFDGKKEYKGSNVLNSIFEIKSTIVCEDIIAPYNFAGLAYKVLFLDNNGNPLKNSKVGYQVQGEYFYYSYTNNQGFATLKCNGLMGPKNYVVTIYNYAANENVKQNVKLARLISGDKDMSMVYNSNIYYKLRIYDIDGKVVGAGEKVEFRINKHIYHILTDENGYVSFKINEKPGTYTIMASYNGAYVDNEIIVKKATPKLTAKAKTFKKSVKTKKYTITLKTNTNKVMKNTKVTLKVNGKTYSAKTNAKGQATFKITKLTKKGKFTAVVKFAGNKYYNAKTVKPKITVK